MFTDYYATFILLPSCIAKLPQLQCFFSFIIQVFKSLYSKILLNFTTDFLSLRNANTCSVFITIQRRFGFSQPLVTHFKSNSSFFPVLFCHSDVQYCHSHVILMSRLYLYLNLARIIFLQVSAKSRNRENCLLYNIITQCSSIVSDISCSLRRNNIYLCLSL